jgi:tetratricopeptide (TPR) repeat protein
LAALWLCALALAAPARPSRKSWPRAAAALGAALALVSWIPKALASAGPARAAALFPAEPGPREDLADAAMAAKNFPEAEARWEEAQAREPFNAIYPWRRAQLAAAGGRWDAAERLAEKAVALEPGFWEARLLRAEALVRLGRAPEARAALDEVRKLRLERGNVATGSGYERTVTSFDPRDYDRVAALAGRPPLGR